MFSIFCRPSKEEGIQYLNHGEKHSTFDTLETEGTDEDSCSVDKNLDKSSTESLLDKVVDTDDDSFMDKATEINEQVVGTREGEELREAVPSLQNEDAVVTDPGLTDLVVPVSVEGPDFATNEMTKGKPDSMNVLGSAMDDSGAGNRHERVKSLAIVLYEPSENREYESNALKPVETTEIEDKDPVQDEHRGEAAVVDGALVEEMSEGAAVNVHAGTSKTEATITGGGSSEDSTGEWTALEPDIEQQKAVGTTEYGTERVTSASDERGEEEIMIEPEDTDSQCADLESIASELLMPISDHTEADLSPEDLVNDVSLGDVTPTGSGESDTSGESLTDASESKSVRFAEPLVTSSWNVPRVHSDDLEALFYTAMDISKFRQQQKGGAPARDYDKAHCERLVEDLDRLGAESFVEGDYQKALGAFNHSLQVKTQIMTDCDNCSTATTIHCIADVYSKKGKWIQAMDAYNAALEVLGRAEDTEEVRLSKVALGQKVHIIRRLLGLKRQTPS